MKDIVIIIIVLAIIIGSGTLMQSYIKTSSEKIVKDLVNLKTDIESKNKIDKDIKKQAEKICENWDDLERTWSKFILHDELDLIETSLVSMNSDVKQNNIEMSMEEIEKSIFLLNHIYEKERFCLKNIF